MDPEEAMHPSYPNRNEPVDFSKKQPSQAQVDHSQIYATSMLFMSLGAFAVNKFVLRNFVRDSIALGGGLLLPFALGDCTNRNFVSMLARFLVPGIDEKNDDYDVTNRYSTTKNKPRVGQIVFTPFM